MNPTMKATLPLSLPFQVPRFKWTRQHLIGGLHLSFNLFVVLLLLLLQISVVSQSALRRADLLADRPDEIASRAGSLGKENKTSNGGASAEEGCIMSTVVGRRGGLRRGWGQEWDAQWWEVGVQRGLGWKKMIRRVWECRRRPGKDGRRWCEMFLFGLRPCETQPKHPLPGTPQAFISHFLSLRALSAFPISFHILSAFTWTWPPAGGRRSFPPLTSPGARSEGLTCPRCVAKSRNVYITCSEESLLQHLFMDLCRNAARATFPTI